MKHNYDIYVETGKKKVFAGAIDWPGWCRSGRDEASAILALFHSGDRYAQVLGPAGLKFIPPKDLSNLTIIERLEGTVSTDFGTPDRAIASDANQIEPAELLRFEKILKAAWLSFDKAVAQAEGKQLRLGPRGGGRDLQQIIDHVTEAERAYLRALGWSVKTSEGESFVQRTGRMRSEIITGLEMSSKGLLPKTGPRGGKRWQPRYFVRRAAWHLIDHAWEIEDRISG